MQVGARGKFFCSWQFDFSIEETTNTTEYGICDRAARNPDETWSGTVELVTCWERTCRQSRSVNRIAFASFSLVYPTAIGRSTRELETTIEKRSLTPGLANRGGMRPDATVEGVLLVKAEIRIPRLGCLSRLFRSFLVQRPIRKTGRWRQSSRVSFSSSHGRLNEFSNQQKSVPVDPS